MTQINLLKYVCKQMEEHKHRKIDIPEINDNIINFVHPSQLCKTLTNKGRNCESFPRKTSFFSKSMNKRVDCTWYCMRKCFPDKIKHLFLNCPEYIYGQSSNSNLEDRKGPLQTEHKVQIIHLSVSGVSGMFSFFGYPKSTFQSSEQKSISKNNSYPTELLDIMKEYMTRWHWTTDDGTRISVDRAANLLCQNIRTSIHEGRTTFKAIISFEGFGRPNRFRFSSPYIQPEENWDIEEGIVSLEFKLS